MSTEAAAEARGDLTRRRIATALWLGVCASIAISLVIWAGRGLPRQPISFAQGPLGMSAIAMTGTVYATVALFLARRLPRNLIGWFFLAVGIGMAAIIPVNLALADALRVFRPIPVPNLILAWGITSVQLPASGALLVIVLLLFPDGRPERGLWRLAAGAAVLGCLLMTVASALQPDGLLWYPTLPNPAAAPRDLLPVLVGTRVAGMAFLVAGLGLAAVRLASRYRRADPIRRRQLGWILAGSVAMGTTLGPLFAVRYAIGAPDAVGERLVFIAAVGGVLFPISVAAACLRERLFGIEAIVNRTLVYVPLMGILGGMYTAAVVLLQRLFVQFTGNTSDAAIVLATLLLAAALTPVRRELEGLVERGTRTAKASGGASTDAPPPSGQATILLAVLERLERIEGRLDALEPGPAARTPRSVATPGFPHLAGEGRPSAAPIEGCRGAQRRRTASHARNPPTATAAAPAQAQNRSPVMKLPGMNPSP